MGYVFTSIRLIFLNWKFSFYNLIIMKLLDEKDVYFTFCLSTDNRWKYLLWGKGKSIPGSLITRQMKLMTSPHCRLDKEIIYWRQYIFHSSVCSYFYLLNIKYAVYVSLINSQKYISTKDVLWPFQSKTVLYLIKDLNTKLFDFS